MKLKRYFLILLLFNLSVNAQSVKKHLAWIHEHKKEVFLPLSYSTGIVHGNQVEFTAEHIRLISKNGQATMVKWKEVINVKQTDFGEDGEIEIVSKNIQEGEHIFINLCVNDDNFRSKFLKAIKNISKGRGARFVKKDLLDDGF